MTDNDDFLAHLGNLPSDLKFQRKQTSEYEETYSEENGDPLDKGFESEEKVDSLVVMQPTELAETLSAEMKQIQKKTKEDRVDMQNYIVDRCKRLTELAIEAVEGMQADVINSADGKLAQAYATLIGTASKSMDTINVIAQEHSRIEHDKEMEEIKLQNKIRLSNATAKKSESPSTVTNNLNIVANREEIMKMLRGESAIDVTPTKE